MVRHKDHLYLLAALLLTSPIIFFQALRHAYPLGYAGMFTLIAESIAQANFALPASIPHYGPGGIPLVYPPFAMYVFAAAIKMGISTWAYLRFVPAVLTFLAIIPFYFLTLELVGSKLAGILAAVLMITAPAVYYTHVWSAGVVRAMALCFCFAGLFFYIRVLRNFSRAGLMLAGLFLGLTFLTHWLYAVFAALVGLACLLAEWKRARAATALGILGMALLLAGPWLAVILGRHGFSPAVLAASSHRNVDFFLSLGEGIPALRFLAENLGHVIDNPYLTALAIPGFLWLLFQRKFQIPLGFVFILFMGEASFYTEILAAMMAGAFVAQAWLWTLGMATARRADLRSFSGLMLSLIVGICSLLSVLHGLTPISQYAPLIDDQSLRVADFIRANTDPRATYLFVGRINEAEWFPYLLDRTPVFSPWGSEWKGLYAEQSEVLLALGRCEDQENWACVEALQQEESVTPDLLITRNRPWLREEIRAAEQWELVHRERRYLVWKRVE